MNTDYWALSLLPGLMQCNSIDEVENYLSDITPQLYQSHTPLSSIYLDYCEGFLGYKKGSYLAAIETLNDVIKVANYGQHITIELYATHCVGVMLFRLGRYDDAAKYLIKGLKAEDLGDNFLLCHVYNMLGNIEYQLGNYQEMNRYFHKARYLDLDEKLLSRHVILTNYAQSFDYLDQPELAFKEFEAANAILERNPSDYAWYLYFGAFAHHLAKQKKYSEALSTYHRAIKLGERISDRFQVAADFLEYCEISIEAELYDDIEIYADQGVEIVKAIESTRLLDGYIQVYSELADINKGDDKKRMVFLEKAIELSQLNSQFSSKSEKRYLSQIYELQQEKAQHANAISLQENLGLMGSMGEYLTTCSDLAELIDRLYEDINLFMRADSFAIGIYNSSEHTLAFDHYIDEGKHVHNVKIDCSENTSITAHCIQTRQPYFTNSYNIEDMAVHLGCAAEDLIRTSKNAQAFHSLIFVPIIIKDELLGIVTVQSKLKHNYQDYHFNLIKQLSSYIGIGLTNIFQKQELIEQRTKFKKLSVTDSLTGVYNRQALEQQYEKHTYNVCLRENQSLLGLLLIDIDHFKQYNDTYGHVAGDDLLGRLGKLFKKQFSHGASIIRYGGDEFLVLLEVSSESELIHYSQQLVDELNSLDLPHRSSPHHDRVTLSIGGAYTQALRCERALPTLIHDADMALYKAKEQGRATFVIVD